MSILRNVSSLHAGNVGNQNGKITLNGKNFYMYLYNITS